MKIETVEERLKKDEYGLYVNASSYQDQRKRMIEGINREKELLNNTPKFLRLLFKLFK